MVNTLNSLVTKFAPKQFKNKLRQRILENTPISTYWQKLNLQHTLQSGVIIKVSSYADWFVYNEVYVDGEYDAPIKMVIQSPHRDRPLNILDLGANVGYFALRVIDLMRQSRIENTAWQITLVEGSPFVFEELETRFVSQNLLSDNITLIHGLVGKRMGSGKIYESEFHAKSTLFDDHTSPGVDVNYIDLSFLLREDYEIDLLKCDIEGAELLFLENYGDLLDKVKVAVFELHHDKCDVQKCFTILDGAGFKQQKTLSTSDLTSLCLFWK